MESAADIRKRLEQNWIQYLKSNAARLSMDSIDGSSPPAVFVGRYGYPKVSVGPMIPPVHGDTTIMDRTELWTGKSLEEIASYRLSLVRGFKPVRINEVSGRYIEDLQEMAMSSAPAESEAVLEKRPLADSNLENEVRLNTEVAPFGPSAPLKSFKTSSPSADNRIEKMYYDGDMKAGDAVIRLYEKGIESSQIHRVLSMGMLGLKKNRKLVPTRWSISAADDMISENLIKQLSDNAEITSFEVRQYSHLANYYSIILIPDSVWNFEMIETWFSANGGSVIASDFEDARGLDHYPSIAGAYFAARLAVAEHLAKRGRKAAALVLRDIHPEYVMPVGVWQIRQGVREAMKNASANFDSMQKALQFACSSLSISNAEVMRKSRIYQNSKTQTRITDFW